MANFALRSKVALIILNAVFWLTGCGIMAVGIWLKADRGMINLSAALQASTITDGHAVVEILAWMCIGTGVFIFVVGACGLLAALRESKLMLMVYVVCLIIVVAGELTVAVLAVVKKDEVIDSLNDNAREYFRMYYNFSDTASEGFNYIMLKFQCCGANDYTDFFLSAYVNGTRRWKTYSANISTACCTIRPEDLKNTTVNGPTPINQTACLLEAAAYADFYRAPTLAASAADRQRGTRGSSSLANQTTTLAATVFPYVTTATGGLAAAQPLYFHPNGCFKDFVDFIRSNIVVVIAVGFSIVVIEILSIVFAVLLYCTIDEEKIYIKQ